MDKTYICDNCGNVALANSRGADCPCGGTYSMDPCEVVLVNLTPHVIRLNGGAEFPPSGVVARVTVDHHQAPALAQIPCFRVRYREVSGLPGPQAHVYYIVSSMVAAACPRRADLLVPATGHPETVRKDGQVHSVPGFVTGH